MINEWFDLGLFTIGAIPRMCETREMGQSPNGRIAFNARISGLRGAYKIVTRSAWRPFRATFAHLLRIDKRVTGRPRKMPR